MTGTETEEVSVEEPTEPEPGEPDPDEPEPNPDVEDRCRAETTVGGTLYRCALEEGHDDEHRFQPAMDDPEPHTTSLKEMRRAAERLNSEAERHAKRIREIMGDDADQLVACELCNPNLGGWRFDVAPDPEVAQRVRAVLGLPDVSNYAPSATENVCNDCRGLGKVRTGSSVPGRETVTCDACAGRGYVNTRPRLNTAEAPPPAPTGTNGEPPLFDDGVRRDMFGTPEGDPDYGKMPGMRERPTDYWLTNRA